MTPFKLAYLSLSRHLFSTIMSIVAIGLSVACAGILLRLYQISESRFSSMGNGGDAIVGAKSGGIEILLNSLNAEGKYPDFLPYSLFQSLKNEQAITHGDGVITKPSSIQSIIPFVYFGKYNQFRIIGTDESFFKRPANRNQITLSQGQLPLKIGEIVVGSAVAEIENIKIGDHIQAQSWTGEYSNPEHFSLTVVGILEKTHSQWDRSLFSNLDQAQLILEKNLNEIKENSIWGSKVLNYFLIYTYPQGYKPLQDLINKRTVGQAIHIETEKEKLQEISGAGKNIGLFVSSFVLILGGLSVCSMLVTRFEGMSTQLAVLRALGYTKRELSGWLLWEGLLLGLFGIILGALLDGFLLPTFRLLLGDSLPPSELVSSSLWQSSLIWIIALVSIIIATFVPMIKMSKTDAHKSLRGL